MPDSPKNPSRFRGPLPDAHAIRTHTVPEAAPPYDDVAAPGATAARERPAERTESAEHPGPLNQAQPAEAIRWPSQFAQVLAEALAGSRPSRQLTPWTTEQARKRINELGPMLSAARQPRVRRVIVSSPAQGVLEMTVIVDYGARARAVAVRLEQPSPPPPAAVVAGEPGINAYRWQRASTTGWVCTAIEAA
jgi:uncharacterized protein DUF6459